MPASTAASLMISLLIIWKIPGLSFEASEMGEVGGLYGVGKLNGGAVRKLGIRLAPENWG